MCDGATLYHAHVQKSEEEVAATAARVEARKALKAERKAAQAANVERKRAEADAKGSRKRRQLEASGAGDGGSEEEDEGDEDEDDADVSENDYQETAEYGDGDAKGHAEVDADDGAYCGMPVPSHWHPQHAAMPASPATAPAQPHTCFGTIGTMMKRNLNGNLSETTMWRNRSSLH